MTIWETSVRRPIGISMLTFIILLFGMVALTHLPIDLMPDITYPTLSISAGYGNASPVEVETLITRPIEQALSAVTGVEEITSTSSEGNSRVRVTFTWGTNLDAAANDIRDRLDRIMGRLPEEVERPTIRKFDLADFPILIMGASGKLDPVQLLKLIEDHVKFRIERIPGVAALDVMGGLKREIHVNLRVEQLKASNLRPEDVITRLRRENVSLPAGIVEAGNYEFTIRTPGEFFQIDQIRDLVVKDDGKTLIRLGEIAEVEDRWEKSRRIVRINGKPGVRLTIQKQSGRNTVEVAEAVMAEIARINTDLPQIHLTTIIDSSKYIKRSIANVSSAAMYGGLLAVLILLFFLGDVRSTLIIGISIPTSIIATFALMYFRGFTLNIMSLGGLALGIGMLVDNAIVVLENIFRYRERGKDRDSASIRGSAEVAMPILASTTTTLVIFLPLLFVEGMTGMMFKQLSWVVGFSLLCSLGVSLTMVPMLCAKLTAEGTRSGFGTGHDRTIREKFLTFLRNRYLEILEAGLRNPWPAILLALSLFVICIFLGRGITTEFMPSADEGEVRVTAEMEVGSRLQMVDERMSALEEIIRKNIPELESVVSTVGGSSWRARGSNQGQFQVPLVGKASRTRSSAEVAAELRKTLAATPGMKIRVREGQGLFIFRIGRGGTDRVEVQIRGHNFDRADDLAKRTELVLKNIAGITDTRLSRESGVPERLISIDRKRAADQKLSVSQIAKYLETLLSGSSAGNFREGGDEYRILVQAKNPERLSLDEILDLTILNSDGKAVALRNVASIISRLGPLEVERQDQERVITVNADVENRPLGVVLAEAAEKLRSIPLPDGFAISLGGDFEEQQRAFRELLLSFFLAIILVYMVMAIQYESFLDPLIVMVTVPLSAIGVVLGLLLTGTSLNVQSFIGCIMLGGIVVNNSILIVDHINFLWREKGQDLATATRNAGSDRFRPVLMTAATTILGLLPLAIGHGEGGEVQAPLARVVIGGLISSTFISLVIIPVVYQLFYGSWRGSLINSPDQSLGTSSEEKPR